MPLADIFGEASQEALDIPGWLTIGWPQADPELREEMLLVMIQGYQIYLKCQQIRKRLQEADDE